MPQRWLAQKRLEWTHYQLTKKNKKLVDWVLKREAILYTILRERTADFKIARVAS